MLHSSLEKVIKAIGVGEIAPLPPVSENMPCVPVPESIVLGPENFDWQVRNLDPMQYRLLSVSRESQPIHLF